MLAGEPVVSPRLNEALCTVLLLDPTQMWQTAGAEKLKRKAKSLGMIAMGSLGIPFIREWRILDQDQRDAIETVVRVMARRDAPGQTKPRDGFVSGEEMNPMQMPVIERTPDRRA